MATRDQGPEGVWLEFLHLLFCCSATAGIISWAIILFRPYLSVVNSCISRQLNWLHPPFDM